MKKYHNWSVSGSFEQSLAASRKAFLGRQNYIRIRKKKLTPRTVVYPQRNEVIHNVTKEVLPLLPKVIVEDKSLLEPYCETIQGKIFNDATKYVAKAHKFVAEATKFVAEAPKYVAEVPKYVPEVPKSYCYRCYRSRRPWSRTSRAFLQKGYGQPRSGGNDLPHSFKVVWCLWSNVDTSN